MPSLDRDGEVFVLNLGDNENRWSPDWLAGTNKALDEVEAAEGPRALVTTSTGKFWSNGLDLEWLGQHSDQLGDYLKQVHDLLARVLELPMPTVAALQGHTFAAGAMLALAHDFRVMRADRGFFCLPEVDIQIPFTPGMSALIQAKLTPSVALEAMTTGRRYGGADAKATAIVDATAPEDGVLSAAIEIARPLTSKPGATLGMIKSRMYPTALTALRNIEGQNFG
ncbi:MAG TPA: enoyl-CoA hydratase-related protein [Pseudonocardia sp.]|nr:enoyl-CoA hydratase-related protein [Pseudonocardia sp.]